MKAFALLVALMGAFAVQQTATADETPQMVCYYHSESYTREGLAQLTLSDLEPAMQFCTHLIYGYAGIHPRSNKLVCYNDKIDLDGGAGLYRKVTDLKKKFPDLKILLSVGGDLDIVDKGNNQYHNVLETIGSRMTFINSVVDLLKKYNFDGLDVAWQFNKNKPYKVKVGLAKLWSSFKNLNVNNVDDVVDEKAEEHKEIFTILMGELKNAFRSDGYLLGLTVLPNVNSSLFYDIPALINHMDYVNLMAYDFRTGAREPTVADFPAPIYELDGRHPEHNVNYQVEYWLKNDCPSTKINVGVAAYARSWKMTTDSGSTGLPPVAGTDGVGPAGVQSRLDGLLSWPEVCSTLPNSSNQYLKGADSALRKVSDPTKRSGIYAYRSADENDENGLWVGYEDPDTAANKAAYIRAKRLGGVALVDLSYDDFRGLCTGDKYPILRAIKYRL